MEEETKYGYWSLNIEATKLEKGEMRAVCNCSACGYEVEMISDFPDICPSCSAIMVDPLDQTDIDGRDICAGDIILCDIAGHKGKVKGKIIHDTQWYLENPVGFRWMYDCDNIQIVEGAIPKGKNLSREFENTNGNRQK